MLVILVGCTSTAFTNLTSIYENMDNLKKNTQSLVEQILHFWLSVLKCAVTTLISIQASGSNVLLFQFV